MPVQIRRILFPIDFSDPSRLAQQYAIELAERFRSELHVLHIVPQTSTPPVDDNHSKPRSAANQKALVKESLKAMRKEFDLNLPQGICLVEVARVGNTVEKILHYAEEQDISLIVMGTHGHTRAVHHLMGWVAEKVVRLATCPVLMVHQKEQPVGGDLSLDSHVSAPAS